jgi:hypothetical protein
MTRPVLLTGRRLRNTVTRSPPYVSPGQAATEAHERPDTVVFKHGPSKQVGMLRLGLVSRTPDVAKPPCFDLTAPKPGGAAAPEDDSEPNYSTSAAISAPELPH